MSTKLANNLKDLLQKNNINLSTLSRGCGIDKPRISRIISGETTNPQIDTLRPIAEFFCISIDQLIGNCPIPYDRDYGIVIPINRLLVPIIDWKNIPYWLEIKNQFIPQKTIDAKSNISSDSFALVIQEKKFEPKFSEGTTLIVDPKAKPKNRDYIITQVEKTSEVTIRQIVIENNKTFLKNVGSNFEMVSIKIQYPCFGVIAEAFMNMSLEF